MTFRVFKNYDWWLLGIYWYFNEANVHRFGISLGPWSFELVIGEWRESK